MASKKLSNVHNSPTEKTKKDVGRLDAYSLKVLENEIDLMGEPNLKFLDYDFPCNDSSYGVENFSDWKYFKRKQFHVPPVNMKSSFLWNPELVDTVKDQRNYKQYKPEKQLSGYRETNQNRAREKRAKRMLAIWRKKPDLARSEADATVASDTLTGKSDSKAKTSGASPSRGRGRSPGKKGKARSQSRDKK